MDNYVDYKQVRGIVLAIVICASAWYTVYLAYSLVQNFLDIFAIAIVTSVAISALKNKIHSWYLLYSTSPSIYPFLTNSFLFNLGRDPKGIFTFNAYGQILFIFFSVLLSLFFRYGLTIAVLLLCMLLLTDIFVRIAFDIVLKLAKLLKLDKYSDFFDTILTINLIILLFATVFFFGSFAIISLGIDLTENGKILIDFLSNWFDSDLLENKISELLNYYQSDIEKLSKSVFSKIEISQKCSVYIEKTKNLNYFDNIVFDTLVDIEDILIYLNISSHQLISLYYNSPGKFHELCWKVISLPLTLIFNNISGVAMAISTMTERIILYFTLVYILLKEKTSIFEKVLGMIPLENKLRYEIIIDLSSTIAGICKTFIYAAVMHYAITFALYSFLDIKLKLTFSVLSAVVGLFPFFGAWFVNLPMILLLAFRWDFRAVIVFVAQYFVVGYLDGVIYASQIEVFNPTLIGIVIVLGIYKFGIFGIFYGPIIMSLGYLIYKLARELNYTNSE